MAFKADIDDTRDALSYKLGKILRFHGATVRYSDEFAKDPTFISKEELVATCDVVIVGVPHSAYKELRIPKLVDVVDPWNVLSSPPPRSQPAQARRQPVASGRDRHEG
jgi:UDP-N-acetyl-D-mannosaminuronic acid dehydrogenase